MAILRFTPKKARLRSATPTDRNSPPPEMTQEQYSEEEVDSTSNADAEPEDDQEVVEDEQDHKSENAPLLMQRSNSTTRNTGHNGAKDSSETGPKRSPQSSPQGSRPKQNRLAYYSELTGGHPC